MGNAIFYTLTVLIWGSTWLAIKFQLGDVDPMVSVAWRFTLVGRIGADRAAYATLLFPIVALGISTVWEGYQWTPEAAFGLSLILAGNLLMLTKKRATGAAPSLPAGARRLWRVRA
jgi:drug/metabolite transporter (DMT)-like permease